MIGNSKMSIFSLMTFFVAILYAGTIPDFSDLETTNIITQNYSEDGAITLTDSDQIQAKCKENKVLHEGAAKTTKLINTFIGTYSISGTLKKIALDKKSYNWGTNNSIYKDETTSQADEISCIDLKKNHICPNWVVDDANEDFSLESFHFLPGVFEFDADNKLTVHFQCNDKDSKKDSQAPKFYSECTFSDTAGESTLRYYAIVNEKELEFDDPKKFCDSYMTVEGKDKCSLWNVPGTIYISGKKTTLPSLFLEKDQTIDLGCETETMALHIKDDSKKVDYFAKFLPYKCNAPDSGASSISLVDSKKFICKTLTEDDMGCFKTVLDNNLYFNYPLRTDDTKAIAFCVGNPKVTISVSCNKNVYTYSKLGKNINKGDLTNYCKEDGEGWKLQNFSSRQKSMSILVSSIILIFVL